MPHALPKPTMSVLLAVVLLIGFSHLAWAHAILMESTPKLHSTVAGPNVPITLRFNVRVDGGRSRLQLLSPDRSSQNLSLAKQSAPAILQSQATGLKPGAYKLKWSVLASDGHMSSGEVPFTVK